MISEAENISCAMEEFVTIAKDAADRVRMVAERMMAEQKRVQALIARDISGREADMRRKIADAQVENGEFYNIEDTVVPPTQEWLDKAKPDGVIAYTPRSEDGTVRTIRTVRKKHISQITYLYSHGVLDDDMFSACRWYKDRHEAAEMEPSAGVSSYGETIRGDAIYGHLPRTEWGAEARDDYRWAREFIKPDMISLFECVVLYDITITDAARLAKCRFRNARAAFLAAVYDLHGGISHRLVRMGQKKNI